MVAFSFIFGLLLVIPIGAADMPTVIALLNSYGGLADAAMGFVLMNKIQIITGSLDGTSGFLLALLMCRAMNRSAWNVLFGAFGQVASEDEAAKAAEAKGTVRSISAEESLALFETAQSVIIVPGYGMAVAKAQYAVAELAGILKESEKEELEHLLRSIESKTSAEVAVATVKTVEPSTLEEYANGLFQDWKIGKKGKDNGVDDLRLINIGDLKKMEPNVNGVVALYSPSTGIVNSHRLMQYFSDTAQSNGVTISYGSEVIDIKKCVNDYEVAVKNNNEVCSLNTKIVINSAGLDSDRIAEMVGIDIDRSNYKLHYCKGQYFRVNHSKSHLIKRLIYPVPKPKSAGLGVHATLDLSGGIRLGPDGRYLKNRIEEYSVDDSQKNSFFVAANRLLPFIHKDDLYADTAGIRPKLQKEGDDFKDFIIREETDKEFRGFINLIGIESPGLTASSAIAKFVLLLLDNLC